MNSVEPARGIREGRFDALVVAGLRGFNGFLHMMLAIALVAASIMVIWEWLMSGIGVVIGVRVATIAGIWFDGGKTPTGSYKKASHHDRIRPGQSLIIAGRCEMLRAHPRISLAGRGALS
jgi:hypothetical protein